MHLQLLYLFKGISNMKSKNFIGSFFNYVLFLMIFYFCSLPVLSVILYGVKGESRMVNTDDILRALTLLRNSVALALLVAAVAVCLGILATFTLYRINFKGRGLMRVFMLLPLINPTFVGSISFLMLFGKRGLITHKLLGLSISPFGWQGIFFLQLLGGITAAYLIISASVSNTDVALEDAARNLGASELQVLLKITLPMMLPEITTAFLMIFLSSMADFTTPMVIGGKFITLATDLYLQITGLYNMRMASISGIFLLVPCFIAFSLQRGYIKRSRYNSDQTICTSIEYSKVKPCIKVGLILLTVTVLCYFTANILFVFVGAFTKSWGYDYTFTLKHLQGAFASNSSRFIKPLINSITLSIITGLGSSFIGVALAYLIQRNKIKHSKWLDFMAMFPAAVPGILLGVGYLVTFKYPFMGIGRYIFTNMQPLILLGTSVVIYIVCIARNINVSMKSCYALLEHIDSDLENAAFNLGASKLQTYRYVIVPLLKDAFTNSYLKVFSSTMTSLGVIIFLLMPKNKVIVQVLFQSLTGGMALGVPSVLALTLSMLTLIMMLLFNFLVYGRNAFVRLRRISK